MWRPLPGNLHVRPLWTLMRNLQRGDFHLGSLGEWHNRGPIPVPDHRHLLGAKIAEPEALSQLVSQCRGSGLHVREWASGGRVSPAAGTGASPNIRDSHTWTASRTPPVRKRMLASLLTPWRDPTDEQKRCSSRFRPIPGNSLLGGKKASRQQAPSAFSAAVLRELCDCLFLVPSTSLFRML